VGTLSSPGSNPYPASYARPAAEGRSPSRFPVAFRPPALAFGIVLLPLEISAFLTVGLPDVIAGPDPIGVVTFCTSEIRPGWAPPAPRDGGVLPADRT
jgi:hypothetical protein